MFTRLAKYSKALKTGFRRFADDRRGNVAVMFALSALPFTIAAGSAVDYERAMNAKANIMQAMDSATVFAATMPNTTTDAQRTAAVLKYVDSNATSQGTTSDAVVSNVAVTNSTTSVTVTGTVSVKTSFTSLIGLSSIDIPALVEVKKGGINLEVSLVLDNTGSMAGQPITDLKAAAANFVTTVMPATQGTFYTKIAVVPYNNSVNLGSTTLAAAARGAILTSPSTSTTPGHSNFQFTSYTGTTQSYPSNNCVTERQGTQAYTDAAASTYPVGLFYGPTGYNDCTVTTMVPLSTSASTLNTAINAMSAGNSTAGQVGIAWGWYALSPTIGIWSGASIPAGYDKLTTTDSTAKVKKVMVLMTDAEYNSAYCNGVISAPSSLSGSGSTSYQIPCSSPLGNSYTQSNAVCSAIKAAGIEVYVITFQLDTTVSQRVALTQNCATDTSHIINAASSTDLNAAFQSLATSITSLYVSK